METIKSSLAVPTAAKGNISLIRVLMIAAVSILGYSPVADAQTTLAEWQAKAVAEYPDLGKPNTTLNSKFRKRVEELKRTDPKYFDDSQWPYTLAKSLDTQTQIIPGIEAAVKPRTGMTKAFQTRTQIYNAELLAEEIRSSPDAFKGKKVCFEGTVKEHYVSPLGDATMFYVTIAPDIICEFKTDTFIKSSYYYIRSLTPGGSESWQLRNQDNHTVLYQAEGGSYNGPKKYKFVGKLLQVNDSVIIHGTVEGIGRIGPVAKGIIMRECIATSELQP